MPSSLPTDDSLSKSVQDFGIGTYDESKFNTDPDEDDGFANGARRSLPDDGGPTDPFGPDRLLSYPMAPSTTSSLVASILRDRMSTSEVPGDPDRPPSDHRPADDTISDNLITPGSKLPNDSNNPSSRSDYYDRMKMGGVEYMWPDEDSGAYACQDKGKSLPTPDKNNATMDNFLGGLGNFWSGYEVEDLSNPTGFPTQNFMEEADYMNQKSEYVFPDQASSNQRQATDIHTVTDLTSKFLKKFGKSNITRRDIMAFLQDEKRPQYMASDVVRCLKHNHNIFIPDVLDKFPVSKKASFNFSLQAHELREKFIDLEIHNLHSPEVSSILRRCSADLAHVAVALSGGPEVRNGQR